MIYELGAYFVFIKDSDQYGNDNHPRKGSICRFVRTKEDILGEKQYLFAMCDNEYGWSAKIKYNPYHIEHRDIDKYEYFWWLKDYKVEEYLSLMEMCEIEI